MYSLLLRKALPFALTFILGSLVGGLFKAVGIGGPSAGNARAFRYSYGGRHHSCRMRFQRRNLVAESNPLTILFKPDAHWPREAMTMIGEEGVDPAHLFVTFGADGKVHEVKADKSYPLSLPVRVITSEAAWDAAEDAARHIQFTPETVDGVPVTVIRSVEIRWIFND